ncbi:MAG: hypothetical protein IJ590_01160 [Rickettsiales bacterium]|nr:hypothetical protein [Rickettsiales bacterium]
MKVGYQGVEGAFSNIAAKQIFPGENYISFKTFFDVLEAIEEGKIDCGIVPIENSYAGRVAGMHNLFRDFCDKNLFIITEKMLKVEHCLCGLEGAEIDAITHIFSHEQALMQCQKNISKMLPNAICEAKENTAVSAKFVSENANKNFAAICSKEACKQYRLTILKENFQDADDNYTLFVGLSKKKNTINSNTTNSNKTILTSLLFEVKNVSGVLYKALKCFAEQDIDLVKIESYIPATSSKSAMFFITTRGNVADENMKMAIKNLNKFAKNVYIFGSYFADRI